MNTTILHWLSDFGVPVLAHEWLYWTITLTCVVFVVYFVDLVCRRLLIPAIRKVTNKTNFKWDDIVLNNAMLKDM